MDQPNGAATTGGPHSSPSNRRPSPPGTAAACHCSGPGRAAPHRSTDRFGRPVRDDSNDGADETAWGCAANPRRMAQALVRASRLQIVEADQLHVVHFGPLLGCHAVIPNDAEHAEDDPDHHGRQVRASRVIAPFSNAGDGSRRAYETIRPASASEQMNDALTFEAFA